MANVRAESPYAGMTVKTKTGMDFIVEDWWQNVYGKSWMLSDGNFAAVKYGVHAAMANLPIDNEVLYGKIDGFGALFHVSELVLPEVS